MQQHGPEDKSCWFSGTQYLSNTLTIAVLGASGDLAKKKTFPSLFSLFNLGYIPETALILGYARSDLSDADLRERIKPFLPDEPKRDKFLERVVYVKGAYDSEEDFGQLDARMAGYESGAKDEGGECDVANRLFYFALPPSVFASAARAVSATCQTNNGWKRVIFEKPFGHSLKSFRKLVDDIDSTFSESQIYRIDHYLGKEMVQNLMALRFTNAMFEPIWNRDHVQSVSIHFKENFGTDGRGGYFDNIGIIRDVMQNHLLQVLSIIAMEPPVSVSGERGSEFLRDEKVKVLQSIEPIKIENVVLGQYLKEIDGQNRPGYRDDDGVPNDSVTPTFATIVFYIRNARWAGVPFIMRAGKALNERKSEIRVQFKRPATADYLFSEAEHSAPNELVMRLQPEEAIYLKMNVKTPGLAQTTTVTEMNLDYQNRFKETEAGEAPEPDAYARLILEVLRGRHATFVREDELQIAWELFDPLLEKIEKERSEPIGYAYGSYV